MKSRLLRVLMVSSMALASTTILAGPTVPVVGAGGTGAVLGDPGEYGVSTYDRAILEGIATKHFKDRQDQDYQFVMNTVGDIELELDALVKLLNGSDGIVRTFVERTGSGDTITLMEYLAKTQAITAQVNLVDNKIKGLLLVPSAIQSQEEVKAKGKALATLPAPLKTDLTKIQDFFEAQKKKALSQAEAFSFLVIMPNKVPKTITGLNFVPEKPIIPPAKMKEMLIQARRDRQLTTDEIQLIDTINLAALEQTRDLIRVLGSSQTYRFQLNEKGKEMNLERLVELFWARDYLRAVYGMPIGAIGVDFRKKKFHTDIFTSRIRFISEFIRTESDLILYQDAVANALYTADLRNKEILGKGTKMLERVMSGVAFVKGESQLAEINALVLKLIERDIRHEMLMTRPGGVNQMRDSYRAVYYTSAEREQYYNELADKYLPEDGFGEDTGGLTEGTLITAFSDSKLGLDAALERIEAAREQLDAINRLNSNSKTRQKINKRRKI